MTSRRGRITNRQSRIQDRLQEEIYGYQAILDQIKMAGADEDLIEVYFRLGADSRGQEQLKGNGRFTGILRKNGSMKEFDNADVLFVASPPFILLDPQPQPGQRWACRPDRVLGHWHDGTPIISVKPKIRMDWCLEIERDLPLLYERLTRLIDFNSRIGPKRRGKKRK